MTDVAQHRHRCLVRQCIRWRLEHGRDWLREWLDKYRGDRDELRADIRAQWERGNRGAVNDWREA